MKIKMFFIAWIGTLLLAACIPATPSVPTPNIALINTAAAQTVMANFTLTAKSAETPASTPTPLDSITITPTLKITLTLAPTQIGNPGATQIVRCDEYSWDDTTVDVNVPDNTQMTAGQSFVKTWKIKNSGTCTWGTGYKIIYSSGDQMSGQPQPLPLPVAPGQEIEISVNFIAPTKLGLYSSTWTLDNGNGTVYSHFFGSNIQGTEHQKPLYVRIVVK